MKILKMSRLIAMGLLCNLLSLYAMEAPGKEYVFLKSSISDMQDLARDISQDTGNSYQIVTNPALVERCLQILGLTTDNTPLDIRYHYDLFN